MYAYAGSSAAASELTPFTQPPETTDSSGLGRQSAAVAEAGAADVQSQLAQLMGVIPNALQTVGPAAAAPAATTPVGSVIDAIYPFAVGIRPFFAAITGAYSPIVGFVLFGGWWLFAGQILGLSQNAPGVASLLSTGGKPAAGLSPLRGGYVASLAPGGAGATASLGHSTLVGSLSVPQGWVTAAPVMRTMASVLPAASPAALAAVPAAAEGGLFGEMAMASLAGRAMAGATVRTVSNGAAGITGGATAAEDVATTATIIVIPAD
jgi:PPE-repeat protein